MTHEENPKCKACGTSQFGTGFDKKTQIFGTGQRGFGNPTWNFQTSSLSICAGSRSPRAKSSDTRSKAGLYSQIIKQTYSGSTTICEIHWSEYKPGSHRILGSIFAQGPKKWQKQIEPIGSSSLNTVMTAWHQARLPRHISYWCLTRFGQKVVVV